MKILASIPALIVACAFGITTSLALAKPEGKSKGKGAEKRSSKENSDRYGGRDAFRFTETQPEKGPASIRTAKDEGQRRSFNSRTSERRQEIEVKFETNKS
ncbi:MAG: hypothetical protein GEU77_03895 [Deltaproteobacteria bacterium]|nr:hypothetical protein [Deltaproteobacteria bacterium]